MQHFRYLKAWQSALLLAEEIRATVARFPRRGYAELKAQMTASAESIGHNIAEGRTEAASDKEYIRFLNTRSDLPESSSRRCGTPKRIASFPSANGTI